jgi:hypothetical protein
MKSSSDPHREFEKAFSQKHVGYVLITCTPPSDSGEMQVKMTYGGSATLAHMLIDGAQAVLDEKSEQEGNHNDHLRLHS